MIIIYFLAKKKKKPTDASNTMAGSKSILVFATTKGNIYALDLLTMEVLWKVQNPKSHGNTLNKLF
jgi:outer membrane protein assembly factor BamB